MPLRLPQVLRFSKVVRSIGPDRLIALRNRLETCLEKPQILRLIDHLKSFGLFTYIVDGLYALCDYIHVGLGIHPPGNSQVRQLQFGVSVIARFRITASADDASLHGAHAGIQLQLSRQGLGWELILRNMRVEAFDIQKNSVATDRLDDGDVPGHQ